MTPSNPKPGEGQVPTHFRREERYIVFKIKDCMIHLGSDQYEDLMHMAAQVGNRRRAMGMTDRKTLVIESDWPEYEPTWKAIQDRMDGKVNAHARLLASNAEMRRNLEAVLALIKDDMNYIGDSAWRIQTLARAALARHPEKESTP